MLAALAAAVPDFVKQAAEALRNASPAMLIIVGAVLFLFSGALKWLVKWIGAGMVIYGLLTLLGYL
ncbi:MAG: hypothetical protein QMD95_00745 [Candidatus Hodarchaeaceae archaeon]|nr:hypothetical protein [Candidatus Hodarchaeaceae archaeon]